MSDFKSSSNNSEEVDLFQLLNFFQKKINSFFVLILKGFKLIFSLIISFLQVLQQHFIKIGVLVIVAFVLGYVYDGSKPKVYSSSMLVKPLFESKYQLVTNIGYYNELSENESYSKLSEIFGLTIEESKTIKEFNISSNLENENIKMKLFDSYVKKIDTSTVKDLSYKLFVENLTIYDAEIFNIEVLASKNNVFPKLSVGFKKSFKSATYSSLKKEKKEALYNLQKIAIKKSLSDIDALKKVYVKVLGNERNQKLQMLGATPLNLVDEQQKTKEFEMLQLQIVEQNNLIRLEKESLEENELFEVISDFQSLGTLDNSLLNKMKFIFPLGAFLFYLLLIFGFKLNRFIATFKIYN
ncbi:hypothetical protein OAX11_03020 [Flavobacteriaceae bacterium]|nr:hypothetical protein [Flavobacteriaceae bacterium]